MLALSHLELVRKSQAVLRLGKTLLACGAGAYRVKSAMARAAKALGLSRHESQVSLMEITTTSWAGLNYRTEVAEIRTVGVNAAKLDMLMVLSTRLHTGMTSGELAEELDRIDRTAPSYTTWQSVGWAAVACAGFSFLNGGRITECATVFVAAGVGQLIRRVMLQRRFTHFLIWILCAAISSLIYAATISAAIHLGVIAEGHEGGIISAILYLIPGFPLITAMLDFVRMDFWSAVTRINYCLMVLGSAGVSVWLVSHLLGWPLTGPAPEPLPMGVAIALRAGTSFIAAYGFAVLFNATWKVAATAAAVGAVINTTRILAQEQGLAWQMGVGLAAFTIGVCATVVARKTAHSRVSLSVPAAVIMIPGVPFYRALAAINEGDYLRAIGSFSEVFFVVMAIGFGLAMARVLLDEGWRHDAETAVLPADLDSTSRAAHF